MLYFTHGLGCWVIGFSEESKSCSITIIRCCPLSRLQKTSYLPKLLHLFVKIRIQFLRYIFHPQQRSSVFGPTLLHSIDRQPCIRYSSVSKCLYFLVKSAQRNAQCQPVTEETQNGNVWDPKINKEFFLF